MIGCGSGAPQRKCFTPAVAAFVHMRAPRCVEHTRRGEHFHTRPFPHFFEKCVSERRVHEYSIGLCILPLTEDALRIEFDDGSMGVDSNPPPAAVELPQAHTRMRLACFIVALSPDVLAD